MAKHWRIFIDWDNDSTCESAEHFRCFSYNATRGRDRMIANDSSGFEKQRTGKANLLFDNDDFRFDPFYTSSPLYGSIAPQRKVQIGVETGGTDILLLESGDALITEDGDDIFLSDGDYYARFTGEIDDIQPISRGGRRSVKMSVLDYWLKLRSTDGVWIDVVSSTNTNTSIDTFLDEISWPDADRDLNGDGDDLDYWWTEGDAASLEIWRLVHSNLGQVYMSNDGKLTFNERQSLYNTTEDITLTENDLGKDVGTPYEWKQIKNKVRVLAHPLIERTTIELWRLIDIPLIQPDDSLTLYCDLTYEDRPVVATAVTSPVATTDYTMNSQADGGGANLTANFSVTETKLGRVVKLVVTNNGITAGYVTLLKLRGDALDSPNLTAVEAEDTDSVYASSVLNMNLIWQQSTETAKDFSLWLLSFLQEPLLFPRVTLTDQDTLTLPNDLFTRARVDLDTLEIDTDYYISKISERWMSETGQGFECEWQLEPADMTLYWQFTTSIGISSRFAY